MKNKSLIIALASSLILCMACDPENVLNRAPENEPDVEKDTTVVTEVPSDFIWESDSVTEISLNNNTISATTSNVTITGTTATITKPGSYSISGNLSNGQLHVDADSGIVKILLKGVTINNTSTSPIYIQKASKTIIFLDDASVNTITDGAVYASTKEPNAAIFSNIYLAFTGTGSLTVKGNYNDGISCDDEVVINDGVITVTAKDDAIRGKDYIIINHGTVKATATTGHALKSEESYNKGCGYVKVNGGNLTLTSSKADGINAAKRIIINSGEISISAASSQGLKSDSLVVIHGGNTVISNSNEGIESPNISISDGTLSILSVDNGINATYSTGIVGNDNSLLSVSGGNISISALAGDGLDSNGNILMTGGTVLIHGPQSQTEVGIDYNGTFNISGGFLAASGIYSTMTQATSPSSTQCTIEITSNTALTSSTLFHMEDSKGNQVLTFKPDRSYSSIVFSSVNLKIGSTYSIYTGGASSGTLNKGLYTGGVYSGGTFKKIFSVTGAVTTVSL